MVDYMNARGMCDKCGEFKGWADGPPHVCGLHVSETVKSNVQFTTMKESDMADETVYTYTLDGLRLSRAMSKITVEYLRAASKFPSFNSAHEGWAVIKEELDELWEVVRENQATLGRNERLKKEAIQVAAMAMRFVIDLPGFKN